MKAKMAFVAGVAAGYVLGARAGKQRYEQIKTGARKAWQSDTVQAKVGDATETVKQQAAPYVVDKLGDTAKSVAATLKRQQGGTAPGRDADLPETITRDSHGDLHADTSGFGPGSSRLP